MHIGRARFVTQKEQLSSHGTQGVDHLLSINWEQEQPPRWAVTPSPRQHLELRRLSDGDGDGDGDEHMTRELWERGRTLSNGKSHPSTKGLNKPISYAKSPPGRLGKNVSSAIEKFSHDTQGGHQPSVFKKGRNQLDGNNQSKRIPSGTKGSTQENFCRAKDVPVQRFYCGKKEQLGKNHEEFIAEASPGSSKWQEASVGEMFLDFESVQIIKEDAEDDSASDLSDSERIPIPPSPCTPPELILRAEEIDPVCLEHIPEMGFKESEYYYPDFLPPPFNSWDLKQLAICAYVEGKSDFRPKPTGSLEKYIERLVQLEWLQMQTVQSEKGRATKARPQTAPGPARALKSPGKGKALLSPVPTRQAVPQEGVPRLPRSCLGHRAEPYSEDTRQVHSHPGHLKLPERTGCAASSQRQTGDGRSELKKKPAAKQQLLSLQPPESSSKIQSVVRNGFGKRENPDWISPGVRNGFGKRENPDWISPGVRNGFGKKENPDWISPGVRNGVGWRENPDWISPGVRNGFGKKENPDWISPGVRNGVGWRENPDWISPGVRNGFGKKENPDWISPGVRNGFGKRENPDWISPGVRNGFGKKENPDWISPGVRNGVGKKENPDWISPGVRNGFGKKENPDWISPGVRNGVGWRENPDWISPGVRNGVGNRTGFLLESGMGSAGKSENPDWNFFWCMEWSKTQTGFFLQYRVGIS
ncbi:hypothetical protein DUI87_27961 [Hirundo rustica rustica]|uniref:Protein FAM217B n=1 Tax=Hirundo rustica rustica TaxID=333673 RepID=A0A3M0J445_HIRRU|nr:hypothetical protein DUI87_27961 [Hirundo rustica rustica]